MMKHILVLEDERPLQEAIVKKLESKGFTVEAARSVDEAMERLKTNPVYQAVWVDHYLLGKESGLDFVAKMKAPGSAWAQVPVFAVSNTASPDKVQSYIAFKTTRFYVKAEHRLEDIIADIDEAVAHPEA